MKNKASRIETEIVLIEKMIGLYCKKQHKQVPLCADCTALSEYARARLRHCPFGNNKTSCSECSIHCYKKDMQEQIKKVMRFSGPRILFYFPFLAFQYFKIKKT